MKYIFFIVLLVLGLGYAGQSDYEDGVIAEMKNNGEYYRLTEEHPNWTEKQIIKYYTQHEQERN